MINAIFAHDSSYGIGKNGALPWPHNSADMKWFSENTKNGVVIMGRKTWESLGSMRLKNRVNIVLTRNIESVVGNPDMVLCAQGDALYETIINITENYASKKLWIIGGAELYKQTIPYCDHLYITAFKQQYDCDTFIDKSLIKPFTQASVKETDDCTFSIWTRL